MVMSDELYKEIARRAKAEIAKIAELHDMMVDNSKNKQYTEAYFCTLRDIVLDVCTQVAEMGVNYKIPSDSMEAVAIIASLDMLLAITGSATYTEHLMDERHASS